MNDYRYFFIETGSTGCPFHVAELKIARSGANSCKLGFDFAPEDKRKASYDLVAFFVFPRVKFC